MGTIKKYTLAKLVLCVLTSDPDKQHALMDSLLVRFGPFDYTSDIFPFTYTHYYDSEMGTPIFRFFLASEKLYDPAELTSVKIMTNAIETEWAHGGKRKVNLDPGFLFLSKFILASTKDGSYRIPLASGIYGEITLVYVNNEFCDSPLTYPDFRSDMYKKILKEIRTIYKNQLKSME